MGEIVDCISQTWRYLFWKLDTVHESYILIECLENAVGDVSLGEAFVNPLELSIVPHTSSILMHGDGVPDTWLSLFKKVFTSENILSTLNIWPSIWKGTDKYWFSHLLKLSSNNLITLLVSYCFNWFS